MKKLKSKVFFTISTILTIFVFAVFLISNARTYSEKKENVKNVLDKMIELSDNANSNNVFMDFTVYNIILDENGMYKETVSHTYEDVIDIVKIKNIANKIIKYHHSKYYIGNLYNAKYSYAFTDNNSLILMDNSEVKNTLTKTRINASPKITPSSSQIAEKTKSLSLTGIVFAFPVVSPEPIYPTVPIAKRDCDSWYPLSFS